MSDPETPDSETMWKSIQHTMSQAFSKRTESCLSISSLFQYVLFEATPSENTDEATVNHFAKIGLHKAFCAYCQPRYQTLKAAIAMGAKTRLRLHLLMQAAEEHLGGQLLKELGASITSMIDHTLRPQTVPVTMGKKNKEIEAQLMDPNDQAMGTEIVYLQEGPEIKNGTFHMTLRTPKTQYEGHIIEVSLTHNDFPTLPITLARAPIKEGMVSFAANLVDFGLENEPDIPLKMIVVSLYLSSG